MLFYLHSVALKLLLLRMPGMDKISPLTSVKDVAGFDVQFTKLFKEHEYALHSLVLRITHSNLHAKDIVQEVFMKLWEHRHRAAAIENMEAWLYRITENKIIDVLRKNAASRKLQVVLWNARLRPNNETEEIVCAKEYIEIIHAAIQQLPPQRKLIYLLNREKGMTYKQISDELQISRHTVKNQLSAALRSIRDWLTHSARTFLLFF